jgi:hypothetical protein
MYIVQPDPHPGRCPNYRPGNYSQESVRCLEYAATEHVCRFPEPRTLVTETGSCHSYTKPQPAPWVRPDNVGVRLKDQGREGMRRLANS